MSGLGDKIAGSAKEVAGKVTGDDTLEAKGKAQQIVGNAKDKADDARDSVGDKVNEKLEDLKQRTDDDK